jgi:predicted O-methyltransferase YrrM
MFSFPALKPNVKQDFHGWFDIHNEEFLKPLIKNANVIIELGAWLGKSTRWFCENSNTQIYSIDHWEGSIEHQGRKDVIDRLPILYETFLVNCWDFKDRIIPIKMNTQAGLYWCADHDVKPDLIFIDASHEYEDVYKDIETSFKLFKSAIIVGDDWKWRNRRLNKRFTVQEAVLDFCKNNNYQLTHNERCWQIKG